MAVSATTLTFLGAAGTVTGSKYLLTIGERRILIDAGMFQGDRAWRRRNWEPFPVPPDSISDILLTHAHTDHCGFLPALVAQGYAGPIWCTAGTRDLASIVLRDAAYLAERDTADAAAGGWSKHDQPLPIYTMADAEATLPLLTQVDYDAELDLGDQITARFTRAGHILGSASIRVRTPATSVLFSGDLGRRDHPVLRSAEPPAAAVHVVVESTYGDRRHPRPANLPHEPFADAIRRTIARGGSVLVPAFAIDRTEVVLRTLAQLRRDQRIPDVPIYVNSPMAAAALDVYRRAGDELRAEPADFADLPRLQITASAEESMALTRSRASGRIVLTSSGMASGGRVLHHLTQMLPDHRNTVVLTGYQAAGTRGRSLLDGAGQIKIHGQYVPVRAEIVQDSEFSVHADADDLDAWLEGLHPRPRTVYVTHGEPDSAAALAERIRSRLGVAAVVPSYGEKVVLSGAPDHPDHPTGDEVGSARPEIEVSLAATVDGLSATRVYDDLRVRSSGARRIVLEGTITIELDGSTRTD